MSYDEVEIEDMNWNDKLQAYTYPCPCGDLFQITLVSVEHLVALWLLSNEAPKLLNILVVNE